LVLGGTADVSLSSSELTSWGALKNSALIFSALVGVV
jgi:hypothetical protein